MGYYSYLSNSQKSGFSFELGSVLINNSFVFLCVGNSNVVADCFGPLVGELLIKQYGLKNVVGCLSHNITKKNLNKEINCIKQKYKNCKIVVVDAALGNIENVGYVNLINSGCVPACATSTLMVGDVSILGVTNVVGIDNLMFLKTTRFNMVLSMAKFVASNIFNSVELLKKLNN